MAIASLKVTRKGFGTPVAGGSTAPFPRAKSCRLADRSKSGRECEETVFVLFFLWSVASAPVAFRVRVWEVMSRGRGPRGGCPPPEGVDVACPPYRRTIAGFAAKNRLPATYSFRETVDDGGLMSYWPSQAHVWRRAAEYLDKILKGAKHADLPVEQRRRSSSW